MKLLTVGLLLFSGTFPAQADAPGHDPLILMHILRASEINTTLMEAQRKGGFSIVINRDNVTHQYIITRTLGGGDTICYRHEAWPGTGDKCEFRQEMAARFALDRKVYITTR